MSLAMDNAEVISDFRERWKLYYKPYFMLPARVEYRSEKAPDVTVEYVVGFQVTGMEANTITFLKSSEELDGDIYHLGFSPEYQKYTLDAIPGTLIITGKSNKLGRYRCAITPLATNLTEAI